MANTIKVVGQVIAETAYWQLDLFLQVINMTKEVISNACCKLKKPSISRHPLFGDR